LLLKKVTITVSYFLESTINNSTELVFRFGNELFLKSTFPTLLLKIRLKDLGILFCKRASRLIYNDSVSKKTKTWW